ERDDQVRDRHRDGHRDRPERDRPVRRALEEDRLVVIERELPDDLRRQRVERPERVGEQQEEGDEVDQDDPGEGCAEGPPEAQPRMPIERRREAAGGPSGRFDAGDGPEWGGGGPARAGGGGGRGGGRGPPPGGQLSPPAATAALEPLRRPVVVRRAPGRAIGTLARRRLPEVHRRQERVVAAVVRLRGGAKILV